VQFHYMVAVYVEVGEGARVSVEGVKDLQRVWVSEVNLADGNVAGYHESVTGLKRYSDGKKASRACLRACRSLGGWSISIELFQTVFNTASC
jgi:hypothetical protein